MGGGSGFTLRSEKAAKCASPARSGGCYQALGRRVCRTTLAFALLCALRAMLCESSATHIFSEQPGFRGWMISTGISQTGKKKKKKRLGRFRRFFPLLQPLSRKSQFFLQRPESGSVIFKSDLMVPPSM